MGDYSKIEYKESGALALALLIIMFWGEPDIVDALIHYLNSAGVCQ